MTNEANSPQQDSQLIMVTGLSGSGKSVALNTLEDLGFYCVDNLPLGLVDAFVDNLQASPGQFRRTALGLDVRSQPENLDGLRDALARLHGAVSGCQLVFLEADDATLTRRYSESRRPHPLADNRSGVSLAQAIANERELLAPLAAQADRVINTSTSNVHQLRREICVSIGEAEPSMTILIESFAFKKGVPPDVDFSFDVRCLPNPHWEPALRALTGREPAVAEFLSSQPLVNDMADDIIGWLDRWIGAFERDQRSFLTVGIGCTGGKHRSVYMTERIAEHLRQSRSHVLTYHRELI